MYGLSDDLHKLGLYITYNINRIDYRLKYSLTSCIFQGTQQRSAFDEIESNQNILEDDGLLAREEEQRDVDQSEYRHEAVVA